LPGWLLRDLLGDPDSVPRAGARASHQPRIDNDANLSVEVIPAAAANLRFLVNELQLLDAVEKIMRE
jgi:hypothetical protein